MSIVLTKTPRKPPDTESLGSRRRQELLLF
jgi:hypothetical protein